MCYREKCCPSLSSRKGRSPERAHCVVERGRVWWPCSKQGCLGVEGIRDGALDTRDLGCLLLC